MPDASAAAPAAAPAAPPADANAVRVVLFGLPAAGKSSLLGALSQAAQTQERLLHGRVYDRSDRLAVLRQRLYEDAPRRTAEEIVPYPIEYRPFLEVGRAAEAPVDAVLYDCDGRAANDLMQRRGDPSDEGPAGSL